MQHLKELYEYREMIFSLVRKDLRGRYKGSVLHDDVRENVSFLP